MRLARFQGTDNRVFLDNKQVRGNVFLMLEEAMALYYDSDLSGLLLSVNPMSDKYQSISPYGYFSGETPACLEQKKLKYPVACKFT